MTKEYERNTPDILEPPDPLATLVYKITHSMDTEKIFLLGTYTANPPQLGIEYDLLVLVKDDDNRPMHEFESLIDNRTHDMAPVEVSIYKLSKVNEMLTKGNYFFWQSCTQNKLIYDRNRVALAHPPCPVLPPPQQLAAVHKPLYDKAAGFMEGALSYCEAGNFQLAAFMLHQSVEHGLNSMLEPLMGFRYQTHNLHKLFKYIRRFNIEIFHLFPRDTDREVILFKLLQKAYIHARYKNNYVIDKNHVIELLERVQLLLERIKIKYAEIIRPIV